MNRVVSMRGTKVVNKGQEGELTKGLEFMASAIGAVIGGLCCQVVLGSEFNVVENFSLVNLVISAMPISLATLSLLNAIKLSK